MLRGAHQAYFAGVAAAIRDEAPNPVPPEQALAVMALIELGIAQRGAAARAGVADFAA